MSWWGKLAGGVFGFMLGGPLGALLGSVLGHNFDKGLAGLEKDSMGGSRAEQERIQSAFFTATFSVMGHLAKADGRVSPEEISQAKAIMAQMDLPPDMRRAAIELFNQGKRHDFPLDEVLQQFRRECRRRTTLIQMFLEIQIQAAWADGRMDTAEEQMLLHICRQLGIPEFLFRQLERMIRAQQAGGHGGNHQGSQGTTSGTPSLKDAYTMLGITRDASDAEVKKAYRRLMSQHHPDKLVAKGLPEEMMKVATRKTREIRKAYEAIKQARGF
ncbi:co-chaperone DjlA [Thiolapillus brandeum]|uniref:Co-chaperone protein DjlA n=1 Tax=Thiolapillus brandeum TaxID=1076588 RepID=A0A7U6GH87_9GAMM|nr:co-chaperone DjlA [Thiolapillus brandeum]BAO43575.1 DnaJ like chaperone protein [Thiolapillus brandeum]